ncbi:MAG: L,D-transpeptidase family protein [Bacillota bacterium]
MSQKILINTAQRYLELYSADKLISHYPVAVGKPATPTPLGNYKVLLKRNNPGGVLGSRWIQFTWQSHGIHGTNQPWLIGQAVSLGCVRMYNQDVIELYDRVEVGTPIKIVATTKDNHNPSTDYYNYKVKAGDTLYHIAQKFNTTIDRLIELNQLSDQDLIYPGQQLKIPK